LGILFEKASALIQCDWMRIDTPDIGELDAGSSDEIVNYAYRGLALYPEIIFQEVIVVIVNRTM
jgi:hypothetical protein